MYHLILQKDESSWHPLFFLSLAHPPPLITVTWFSLGNTGSPGSALWFRLSRAYLPGPRWPCGPGLDNWNTLVPGLCERARAGQLLFLSSTLLSPSLPSYLLPLLFFFLPSVLLCIFVKISVPWFIISTFKTWILWSIIKRHKGTSINEQGRKTTPVVVKALDGYWR